VARASKASAASKKKAATPKKATTKAAATTSKSSGSSKSSTKAAAKSATKATKKAAATKESASKGSAKKAASTAKPSRKKSPFDSKFLERMRKLLHVERDTYERQAKQLRAEADSLVMDMDPGDVQFDEESGEGDTIAVERGRDLALAAKAMEMIEEIDHALTKFDLGTYGICEVSGEPIPEERLEAIPWAREKVEYKVGGFGRR
jgi:RNA polymerase-binding transcription factor DksA